MEAAEAPATNGDGGFGAFDDGAADGRAQEAAAEEPPAADGFDFDDAGAEEEAELERSAEGARARVPADRECHRERPPPTAPARPPPTPARRQPTLAAASLVSVDALDEMQFGGLGVAAAGDDVTPSAGDAFSASDVTDDEFNRLFGPTE